MGAVLRRDGRRLRMMDMSPWAWPAVAFGAILCLAALWRRKFALAGGFVAYALLALWLATATVPVLRFLGPLLVLLTGYWLTAPFYTAPSGRLEAWLMRYDDRLGVDRVAAATPGWVKALLEIAYVGVTPFMVIAALPAYAASPEAFGWYWTLVLSAELACYVTLPWLQARPPRKIGDGSHLYADRKNETRPHFLRRLNEAVLDRFSVRATTIPSGHVAGPIAASLAIWMIAPAWAPWLLAAALIISAATVIGRYHYAIDAALGLAVGTLPAVLRSFWL